MRTFPAKSLTLLGITFLLMLGLFKVNGMVDERLQYRQQAIAEVSDGLSGAQTLAGPMLMLPYQEEWKESKVDEKLKIVSIEDRVDHHRLWVLPESLEISGEMNPDFRKRGLFKVAGYESKLMLKGHFILPKEPPKPENIKTGKVALEEGACGDSRTTRHREDSQSSWLRGEDSTPLPRPWADAASRLLSSAARTLPDPV